MVAGTVKSLKAGSNFTLKKGISCPDNGEGLIIHNTHFKGLCYNKGNLVLAGWTGTHLRALKRLKPLLLTNSQHLYSENFLFPHLPEEK